MLKLGLQLYTVRSETQKDFMGTLEKVAKVGYKGVEFAGFGGFSAAELKAKLQELGLEAPSSHVSIDNLKDNVDELIAFHSELGIKYMICAWAKAENKEQYLEQASLFNQVAKKCAEKGIKFGYHNHAHELEMVDGKHGLDILMENTDPNLVIGAFDTCWLFAGGVDPAEYIRKYKGRCPAIHIKDTDDSKRKTLEIGEGVVDIKSIMKAAKEIGTEWLIVEQDNCRRPCLESIEISYKNAMKMLEELGEA